ncbi:MAG: magnesium/cobalt transporter CorA [Pseudomonadota bacterium]
MLITCVAYQKGRKVGEIPIAGISAYLAQTENFVWIALKDVEPDELKSMQEQFNLHPLAVEDARNGHQRPKIEEYEDSIFAALHTVELAEGEIHVGEVAVFMGSNYLVSIRTGTKVGFHAVRARSEREPHLLQNGASFVFYALIDEIVDRYFPVIEHLEVKLEEIEEQIFSQKFRRDDIYKLYALKQETMRLKHAVYPLMDDTAKLYKKGHIPQACSGNEEYFRDIYDHLYRIDTSIDNILDTIATAIQVSFSIVAIEESEVNKRLAAWAAIFAVATFFVGVWGMNFKHMPELEWEFGYPVALGIIFCVCGYLYYRFKKSGWL